MKLYLVSIHWETEDGDALQYVVAGKTMSEALTAATDYCGEDAVAFAQVEILNAEKPIAMISNTAFVAPSDEVAETADED